MKRSSNGIRSSNFFSAIVENPAAAGFFWLSVSDLFHGQWVECWHYFFGQGDACMHQIIRYFERTLIIMVLMSASVAWAQSKNLAPGFTNLPRGSTIIFMQPDMELFSISAGGVPEPKADWTDAAMKHVQTALKSRAGQLGLQFKELSESEADELAEVNNLHAAVARSIALHHMTGGVYALPTKEGKLDWSLGEAVLPLRAKTGSDYALFVWVRDSYASAERKAAIVVMALLGIGMTGGIQIGYASLVDLRTGQVLWFNQLARGMGDLREAEPAAETVNSLLKNFPESK